MIVHPMKSHFLGLYFFCIKFKASIYEIYKEVNGKIVIAVVKDTWEI
ncbi:hypothetical protein SAMN04488541_10623 [Thermoflexibacter ruber]|uniref:Uncharacterized protein n=1 Tax=Thermoflexibacter ruber TaxID=1003 RepID=A0A1I2JWZ9_9BACT|nr:hypothetical protein SAMN04488541_10623 [Thermoflexibacter ruber]